MTPILIHLVLSLAGLFYVLQKNRRDRSTVTFFTVRLTDRESIHYILVKHAAGYLSVR